MPSPDIEIYLHAVPADAIRDWLTLRFPAEAALPWRPAGKRQWRSKVMHEGQTLPVLVIEEASAGFTSVWFDSAHSPWADDHACAREAFAHFQTPVRATPGSWQEGDDPDLWWEISASGERELSWPG
ncbi:MAG: hypothetical protein Q8J78_13815 [Moraxellaceae bacterium]|nr:hypothetical protein [Moraxellaceae bacterium]